MSLDALVCSFIHFHCSTSVILNFNWAHCNDNDATLWEPRWNPIVCQNVVCLVHRPSPSTSKVVVSHITHAEVPVAMPQRLQAGGWYGLAVVVTEISAFGPVLSLSLIAIYTLRAVLWSSMSTLDSKHHGIINCSPPACQTWQQLLGCFLTILLALSLFVDSFKDFTKA